MKTERRHELHQNTLAEFLVQGGHQLQPLLRWVGAALILFAVLWGGFNMLKRSRSRQVVSGWREYEIATRSADIEGLRQLAESARNTPVAARALQAAGMLSLEDGVRRLLSDREGALVTLRDAEEDLTSALNLQPKDSILRAQTRLGLAQVYESTNELAKAVEQYRRVVEDSASHPFAQLAADRLKFLELPDTKAFCDWFAQQKVTPPSITRSVAPEGGSAPRPPGVYDDLPSSDFSLPSRDDLLPSESEKSIGPLVPPESAQVPETPGSSAESETAPPTGADPSALELAPADASSESAEDPPAGESSSASDDTDNPPESSADPS